MKERLTGAIILVALIVLLVPELLTGPIRTTATPAVSATAAFPPALSAARTAGAEPPLHTYTLTLGGAPAGDALASPAAQAPVQAAESASQIAPASLARTPTATAHAAAPASERRRRATGTDLQATKSPAHQSLRESHSAGSSGGWVVQLGSFASRQNADRLAHALAGRGFRMSVSPAHAGSRLLWRVRAGPVRDRTGAQHLAARLRALGHRGELLPLR